MNKQIKTLSEYLYHIIHIHVYKEIITRFVVMILSEEPDLLSGFRKQNRG